MEESQDSGCGETKQPAMQAKQNNDDNRATNTHTHTHARAQEDARHARGVKSVCETVGSRLSYSPSLHSHKAVRRPRRHGAREDDAATQQHNK